MEKDAVKKEETKESRVSGSAPSPPASPVLTDKDKAAIGQKYAGMSTDNFFALPSIPFKHGSKDLVRFQETLRRNIALCRMIVGDMSQANWVPGWEMTIEKHVHRAVAARTLSIKEVGELKEQLGSAFARFQERLDEGVHRPAAAEFLVRVLPPVAGVSKEERLGRLVQHNTGLGIGVEKDTPNNGKGSCLGLLSVLRRMEVITPRCGRNRTLSG